MTTIKDVAKRAKVATSTVSYIINNKKKVKKETKERVLKAIEELNYSPNLVARSLKTKKSNSIGVIVPDLSNEFFIDIIKGIEDTMSVEGYTIILCSTYEDPIKETTYLKVLLKKNIDGLIFIGIGRSQSIEQKARDIPIVIVDRKLGKNLPSVTVNNEKGGFLATDFLLNKRNSDVILLTGPLSINTYFERKVGYMQAYKIHNHEPNEQLIINCEVNHEGGFHAMETLLNEGVSFQSVFASNDLIALGAMKAIFKMGLKIPDDILIIGYDGIKASLFINPELTTIEQPRYLMGTKSAEILLKEMKNQNILNKHIVLEPKLIVRGTT
jgi:DNA-binding LacI/PurR family transcriptional regulator